MFLLGRAETGKGVIVWLGPVSRETFFLGTRHWRQFMLISACVETAVVAVFFVSWPRGLLECCSGRHGGIANVIVRGHVSCYWWLASLAAPLHQEPPAWVDLPFFFLSGVRRVCPWQWLTCWQGNERKAAFRKLHVSCLVLRCAVLLLTELWWAIE